jgi:AcrR family transcriptional regulator
MPQIRKDLRVQRTLEAIHGALGAVVAEKGLDATTVGDIARRARINRATFYRHYRDKFDALEASIASALAELEVEMGPRASRSRRFRAEEVPLPWIRLFERIEADANLYCAILRSSGSAWFQARLSQRIEGLLRSGARPSAQVRQGQRPPPGGGGVPEEIVAAFSARLFVGVAAWWLDHQGKYTAVEIATWLRRMVFRGLLGAA